MAALTLRISSPAAHDLQEISAYGAQNWGRNKANRYLDDLTSIIGNLLDNPHLGLNRDDMELGIRSIPVRQHVIFYRVIKNEIEIVRVLHERQDIKILSL